MINEAFKQCVMLGIFTISGIFKVVTHAMTLTILVALFLLMLHVRDMILLLLVIDRLLSVVC